MELPRSASSATVIVWPMLSEAIGYTKTMPGYIEVPAYLVGGSTRPRRRSEIRIPDLSDITRALEQLGLRSDHIVVASELTDLGKDLLVYFQHRALALHAIQSKLMDAPEAEQLYKEQTAKYVNVACPQPMNKQSGAKKAKAFLTCLVNTLVAGNSAGLPCNYDPQELTKLTTDKVPFRTLARRVDGAFPSATDPIAIWEIKEYYYTTTFGSRIADGVYETLLDGMEIEEASKHGCDIEHYLMIDSNYTWWGCGKSYLCRIVDMLHMGLVDEVLFGREVVEELPRIVRSWIAKEKAAGSDEDEQ